MKSVLGIALALAACGGPSKPTPAAPPAEEQAVDPPANEVDVQGDEWGPEEDEHGGVKPEPGPAQPLDQASIDAGGTGSPTCDELIRRMQCLFKSSQVPAEAMKAWEDGIKMWTEALQNDATRQAVIDTCQMSLEGAIAGLEAAGC